MKIKISAPGKIILSGEHAVVYGKPALVAAIDKRMEIIIEEKGSKFQAAASKLNQLIISGRSKIPIGCGMGSSAALAVIKAAVVNEIFNLGLSKDNINEIAYDLEKETHGNPSGVDNSIAAFGGFIWYRKEFEFLKNISQLPIKLPKVLDKFVLVGSGKPVESTKEMVNNLKTQMSNVKTKSKILNLFNKIEEQTKKMLLAIRKESEKDLKDAIKENGRLLETLGVVSEKTKKIVKKIEKIGGVAKITGAGGTKKGSGMLLCYHQKPEKIVKLGEKLELEMMKVRLGQRGLRVTRNYETTKERN